MQKRRRQIMTAVLALLLAGGMLALRAARPERPAEFVAAPDWQPQTWYRLDGHGSIVSCELPAGSRYRLVVGCLNDAPEDHAARISLTASRLNRIGSRTEVCPKGPGVFFRSAVLGKDKRTFFDADLKKTPDPFARAGSSLDPLREFFLHVTDGDLDDPKQYARIKTRCVACGKRVRVLVDQQLKDGEVSPARIDELVQMLETEILPRVESQFGELRDVDGDGRFAVVLTPWLSRLQGGRTSLGGMVRSSDFQLGVSPPLGNRSDMLYLNSSLPSGAALRDLLSHEVAHAACISQRLPRGRGVFRDEDDWLSEALAHLAEPGWSNLDHRLAAFVDDPSRYPLVVSDYYRAGLWRNAGCRGATFLFTRWCVARHGPSLVRRLAQSTECGIRNLERATGERFEDLFHEWSLSLADGDEFVTPELRSVLKRVGSEGLQRKTCDANCSEQTLRLRGTSFAVIEILTDDSQPQTLRIVGDSAVEWQFSICRISEAATDDTAAPTLGVITHGSGEIRRSVLRN